MKEEMICIPKSVHDFERKMRPFGATFEEIYKKKFNIFIGISISNKKLTPKMAISYLKWALRNTKNKVAVVIADELNIVNYKILDKYSSGKAINRSKRVGDKFEKIFHDVILKLSPLEKKKVNIYRWEQIREDRRYLEVLNFFNKEYKKDVEFKSAILYFVKKYMRKKGRIVNDSRKIDELATYILGELPTLSEGIFIGKDYYGLCIYPTYFASGMSPFVMDIHANELDVGKKLKKIIKCKAILVEDWLD